MIFFVWQKSSKRYYPTKLSINLTSGMIMPTKKLLHDWNTVKITIIHTTLKTIIHYRSINHNYTQREKQHTKLMLWAALQHWTHIIGRCTIYIILTSCGYSQWCCFFRSRIISLAVNTLRVEPSIYLVDRTCLAGVAFFSWWLKSFHSPAPQARPTMKVLGSSQTPRLLNLYSFSVSSW